MSKNPNHPAKGSKIKIEPIRKLEHIDAIIELLQNKPREKALFLLGVNWGLRASDLIRLKVSQVKYVELADSFLIYEKKTGKERRLSMNKQCFTAIHELIAGLNLVGSDYLFKGQRKSKVVIKHKNKDDETKLEDHISVQFVNLLVKQWTKAIGLRGKYGSHTLRKSFGYIKRVHQRVDIPTLMSIFGHSSQQMTLRYLCIQDEEVRDVYLNGIGG